MNTTTKKLTFDIPPRADRGACRSCGTPIAWVVTSAGKRMPVEIESRESHFARCPEAARWRKAR